MNLEDIMDKERELRGNSFILENVLLSDKDKDKLNYPDIKIYKQESKYSIEYPCAWKDDNKLDMFADWVGVFIFMIPSEPPTALFTYGKTVKICELKPNFLAAYNALKAKNILEMPKDAIYYVYGNDYGAVAVVASDDIKHKENAEKFYKIIAMGIRKSGDIYFYDFSGNCAESVWKQYLGLEGKIYPWKLSEYLFINKSATNKCTFEKHSSLDTIGVLGKYSDIDGSSHIYHNTLEELSSEVLLSLADYLKPKSNKVVIIRRKNGSYCNALGKHGGFDQIVACAYKANDTNAIKKSIFWDKISESEKESFEKVWQDELFNLEGKV